MRARIKIQKKELETQESVRSSNLCINGLAGGEKKMRQK